MSTEKYQFKGTPGGWIFVETQSIGRSINECDYNIAVWDKDKGRYDTFINCWNERCNIGFDTNKEQARANAHLIAAAPELLQACIEALWHEENGEVAAQRQGRPRYSQRVEMYKAAIHKALNVTE